MVKEFTVMLLSEKSGKHFTVKISLFTVIFFLVFLLMMIVATTISLNRYIHILDQNNSFQSLVNELGDNISNLRIENRDAGLYKQWAEKIIFRRFYFEKMTQNNSNGFLDNLLDGDIPDNKTRYTRLFMGVDDFDVNRINLELDFDFSFKLVNQSPGNKRLSGYVFIIASNYEVIPEIFESWPSATIVSGLPKDYKQGIKFTIRYLKQIKGRINQPDIGNKFNRLDLIAYSEAGEIIMKKGFYIERLLHQGPEE